jgi:hypothetical protein
MTVSPVAPTSATHLHPTKSLTRFGGDPRPRALPALRCSAKDGSS